jgi:hypothetical protein
MKSSGLRPSQEWYHALPRVTQPPGTAPSPTQGHHHEDDYVSKLSLLGFERDRHPFILR